MSSPEPRPLPSLRKAVFFDRDNTLIVGSEYLGDPAGVVLVDGAAAVIAALREMGYLIVTASNQSGVARGYFTEQQVQAVNARMDQLLRESDPRAVIDRHEYCPEHPEATVRRYRHDSPRRKPAPGMLFDAARSLGIDLSRSWMVGDVPRDIDAGSAAGCRTILVVNAAHAPSPAASVPGAATADHQVRDLREVVAIVRAG